MKEDIKKAGKNPQECGPGKCASETKHEHGREHGREKETQGKSTSNWEQRKHEQKK